METHFGAEYVLNTLHVPYSDVAQFLAALGCGRGDFPQTYPRSPSL